MQLLRISISVFGMNILVSGLASQGEIDDHLHAIVSVKTNKRIRTAINLYQGSVTSLLFIKARLLKSASRNVHKIPLPGKVM